MEQPSSALNSERTVVVVEGMGQRFFVDPGTGEILNPPQQHKQRQWRDLRQFGYIGKEPPWPLLARNAEELQAATEAFDWYPDRLSVSARKILDLLHTGVADNAVRLFDYMAQHVAGRNVWFGQIHDLSNGLDMPKRTTERALQTLQEHRLIERRSQGRLWPLRIDLHPWYVWKGDYMPREHTLQQWASRSAKFGGETSPQASKQAA